jgi:excisionase family DNA binding protein
LTSRIERVSAAPRLASALRFYQGIPGGFMAVTEQATEPRLEPRIGRSVSLDHAAELLGVSRRTIYNRIREGRLLTVRTLGGSQRVLLDSVQRGARPVRPAPVVGDSL